MNNSTYAGVDVREIDLVIRKTISGMKCPRWLKQDLVQESWIRLLDRKVKKGYSPEMLASLVTKSTVLDAMRKYVRRQDIAKVISWDQSGLVPGDRNRPDKDRAWEEYVAFQHDSGFSESEMIEFRVDLEREKPGFDHNELPRKYFRGIRRRSRKNAAKKSVLVEKPKDFLLI